MAAIRPNDNAPDDTVKYIFPLETFDLAPGGEHETDDRNTLSAAEAHPWLDVQYPEAAELSVVPESKSVPYDQDVLAAPQSVAFDEDAIRESLEAREALVHERTAIEAGLDQGEAKEVAGTNVTLAADAADTVDPEAEKPSKGSKKESK